MGRVPELRGGWGGSLSSVGGGVPPSSTSLAHSGLSVGDLPPKALTHSSEHGPPSHCTQASIGGSVSLERASLQAASQGKGRDQCWRGTLCLPPPTSQARLLGNLGGWGEGRGVCCVIQARFCQGCLEATSWRRRQSPPPRCLTETSVGGRPMRHPGLACHRLGLCTPSRSYGSGVNWAHELLSLPVHGDQRPSWPTPSPGAAGERRRPAPQHCSRGAPGAVSAPVWAVPSSHGAPEGQAGGGPLAAACPASAPLRGCPA